MKSKDSLFPGRTVKGKKPEEWVQHNNEPYEKADPLLCGSCQTEYENWYANGFKTFMKAGKK
jgi:hypothetical protein